jgi:hypothetical protein
MQASFFKEEEVSGYFRDRLLTISRETLEKNVKSCKTYPSLCRRLRLTEQLYGSDRQWLISRLDYEGIDHSHMEAAGRAETRGRTISRLPFYTEMTNEYILSTYFVVDSPCSWASIKRMIKDRKLLPDNCSQCGIGPKWNGVPLVLQYDHINGVNTDQRLENLRSICPNCHTQTDTFGGRNAQKVDWESFAEAMEAKKKFDIPPPDGG